MAKFEKFRRSNITSGAVPMVALHQRGVIALNQQAFEALKEPEGIELFFDRDTLSIGLKGAPRNSPDSYAVRHHTKSSSQIAGQSFLEFYEVPHDLRGRRYRAELEDDMLVVDLRQEPEE